MKLLRNAAVAVTLSASVLAACQGPSEVLYQGYVVDQETLALAPVGSSREQVLLSLGTPSSTATFDNEVFYYISQTRKRSVAFAITILIILLFSKNAYSASFSSFYTFYLIGKFGISVQNSQVMLFLFLGWSVAMLVYYNVRDNR